MCAVIFAEICKTLRGKFVSAPFSASSASDIVGLGVIVGILGEIKCSNSTLPRLTMTAIIGPLLHVQPRHDLPLAC